LWVGWAMVDAFLGILFQLAANLMAWELLRRSMFRRWPEIAIRRHILGRRFILMTCCAAVVTVISGLISPFTFGQIAMGDLATLTLVAADAGRLTLIETGFAPVWRSPADWIAIWNARWHAYCLCLAAPEDIWSDVREQIVALTWSHLPTLLLEQRELDSQIIGITHALERHIKAPEDAGRMALYEQATRDQALLKGLRERNEQRIAMIGDLLGYLPGQLYLARRNEGAAGEALDRCRSVVAAIENHTATRHEIEGPTD